MIKDLKINKNYIKEEEENHTSTVSGLLCPVRFLNELNHLNRIRSSQHMRGPYRGKVMRDNHTVCHN